MSYSKEIMESSEKRKHKKPQLVVLSAPSGAGKSTICKLLIERNPDFRLSISATTRPPRPTEIDGIHYYFISEEEFQKHIQQGDFIEYERVHGHYYGTLKNKLEKLIKNGYTILFDIDVNGALNIKKLFPHAILIFIRPPSLEELKHRLRNRKSDSEEAIEMRLKRLPEEYAKAAFFDYDIVNDDLDQTVDRITQIIRNHQKRDFYVSNKSVKR